MTNSYRKESPLAGFAGFGGGAQGLPMTGGSVVGQAEFTTDGTETDDRHYWVCPEGVTSISIVCIGAGSYGNYNRPNPSSGTTKGGGGGGGGLGYKNDYAVTPGTTYHIYCGKGDTTSSSQYVKDSWFSPATATSNSTTSDGAPVRGRGGQGTASNGGGTFNGFGGTYTGDGGGNGGDGGDALGASGISELASSGGGGAGGYAGNGGNGGSTGSGWGDAGNGADGAANSGAGGGGGGNAFYSSGGVYKAYGGGGGGVGLYGKGSTGTGGTGQGGGYNPSPPDYGEGGGAGSNGTAGGDGQSNAGGTGGLYGGGSCGTSKNANVASDKPGRGAVRLIWPGDARQFPSTRTADE